MKKFIGMAIAFASLVSAPAFASDRSPFPYATGLEVPADADYGVPFISWPDRDSRDLPAKYDLRELGQVSPVKNQGSCGSCWAFAGAAVMESAALRMLNKSFDLSEQELVSCDRAESSGCSGGWAPFEYMTKRGIGLEVDFPYQGRNLSCKKIDPAVKGARWARVGQSGRAPTVAEVRQAIHEFGALWVSVAADSSWRSPKEYNRSCSSGTVNHAVTMVGYQPDGESNFDFIIKNSWGDNWNGDGFIKSHLGCDSLARHTSFIVPANSACVPPEFGLPKKIVMNGPTELRIPSLDAEGKSYEWYRNGQRVGGHRGITVEPGDDGDYTVVTRNSCGQWELKVKLETAAE